jgi:hypothetical protein
MSQRAPDVFFDRVKGRNHLTESGIDGGIIIKWILNEL